MLSTLASQFRQLSKDVASEDVQRAEIKQGVIYQDYESTIEELKKAQNNMLSSVCDSTEALDDVKEDIIEEFNKQNLDHYDDLVAKKRESKSVNCDKFLGIIGGDIGVFLELTGITQKSLKDFAKLPNNKGLYKPIMNCVEVVGTKIVDIQIT